ncbi:MAG: hypothetical protein ACI4UN_01500 [Muribaculaceae bacterium]
MRYAFIDIDKAAEAGISTRFRVSKDGKIVVSERDLMAVNKMSHEGLDELAASLGGELVSEYEMIDELNKNKQDEQLQSTK